ncbi:hypothetical protein [Microbulbifer sp. JMSA002]|uniref:hypothetical protein n=1 Tax=Microbulbifer sp. JMSA002 TaxID=3243368 RepID=UPI00403953D4
MTFKSEILKAVKTKATKYYGWKFIYNKYYIQPEKYCEVIIDPEWSFHGSPSSILLQPAAGIYIPEVDKIYGELDDCIPVRRLMFYIDLDHQALDKTHSRRIYVQDFGSQDEAVAEVLHRMDCIFTVGKDYLTNQYNFESREGFYESVPEETRGFGCAYYCVVKGLLGDIDYIKRVLRKEIDPMGYQDLELIGKIYDYFS